MIERRPMGKPQAIMWGKRIFWMVVIWSGSVFALAIAALALRELMGFAGMIG